MDATKARETADQCNKERDNARRAKIEAYKREMKRLADKYVGVILECVEENAQKGLCQFSEGFEENTPGIDRLDRHSKFVALAELLTTKLTQLGYEANIHVELVYSSAESAYPSEPRMYIEVRW